MIMGYFAQLRKTTISKFNITSTFEQEKISNGLQHSYNLIMNMFTIIRIVIPCLHWKTASLQFKYQTY